MGGTRGMGRIVAIGIALALGLVLLATGEARAGKYAVAQCGWYVGADASWADTTGGAKFRPDGYCVPPAGTDPFSGAHLKSFTRGGQATVSGNRFARWRWDAPAGTGITQIRGTWWHALHDGLEQRIGSITGSGFTPFMQAAATDTTPRDFTKGFTTPVPAIEDRLLCARSETRWCSLEQESWSAVRALTITVEDDLVPGAGIAGDLLAGGWRRGVQSGEAWGSDTGSGLRFGELRLDGARVGLGEFSCSEALIGGEWRATRMQPCPLQTGTALPVATTSFSDGPHSVTACVSDFAGNSSCTPPRTVLIDNNPPAHPRAVQLAGGEGWRRFDDFDVSWENPAQGAASPIGAASWQVTGPNGYDTGAQRAPGRDRHDLGDLTVPGPGTYSLRIWLRDEAENEDPGTAVTVPLRFDDVRPTTAFSLQQPADQVSADVSDADSGPASGSIFYRRLDAEHWSELPTKLVPGPEAGTARLAAPMPDLGFGTYAFRVDAVDAAGNTASSTLRADGTQMAVRRVAPPPPPQRPHGPQAKTRLFARLRGGHGRGDELTVHFAAPALLSGRLTDAEGDGIAGRGLRVVARPSRGALAPTTVQTVRTGESGGFELRLPAGPSRRISVAFAGEDGLQPARRPALRLRVRSGVSLRVKPVRLRTGQVLRLSGKVRTQGAPVPRRGKLVAIQYREAATHRWRPVLVARSDHHGRFRAHYRFRYIDGRASIRLRATALAEEHWPYAPGSSAPVTIRVSG